MKKKILAIVLAAGMCLSSLPVSAQEPETTTETAKNAASVDEIMELQKSFNEGVESITMHMNMNLDAAVDITSPDTPDSTLALTTNGDYDYQCILEPMQIAMTGDISASIMEVAENLRMESYMLLSDDQKTINNYTKVNDGINESSWVNQKIDLSSILETLHISDFSDLKNMDVTQLLPESAELDWEVAENDNAYEMSAVLKFAQFIPLMEEAIRSSGQEIDASSKEIIDTVMESLVIHFTESIDKKTGALLSIRMDLNDSNVDALNEMISGLIAFSAQMGAGDSSQSITLPEATLRLNDLSFEFNYTYNNVDEIVIPADALTAETQEL